MVAYDVSFSIRDGLSFGSIAKANDESASRTEHESGELTERAWKQGVQTIGCA